MIFLLKESLNLIASLDGVTTLNSWMDNTTFEQITGFPEDFESPTSTSQTSPSFSSTSQDSPAFSTTQLLQLQ
jgi:hypothetical protein